MDFTEGGMAISLISVSIAVLKMAWDGKKQSNNNSEKNNNNTERVRLNGVQDKIDAVRLQKDLSERPTFRESDERYPNIGLCEEIHKRIDEKLECLPEIKESLIKVKIKLGIEE